LRKSFYIFEYSYPKCNNSEMEISNFMFLFFFSKSFSLKKFQQNFQIKLTKNFSSRLIFHCTLILFHSDFIQLKIQILNGLFCFIWIKVSKQLEKMPDILKGFSFYKTYRIWKIKKIVLRNDGCLEISNLTPSK